MNQFTEASIEEVRECALRHYVKASAAVSESHSFVIDAINAYKVEPEKQDNFDKFIDRLFYVISIGFWFLLSCISKSDSNIRRWYLWRW